MLKRVLVTGKNGQLGRSLQKVAKQYPQLELVFTDRSTLDLSSPQSIDAFFARQPAPFIAIINAAAYTAVDKAESEPEQADQMNHRAVGHLAQIARAQNIFLLHISTDYVFDGQNYRPYIETDSVAPQNVYGLTKLKGEQAMQASGCAGAVIRTSWLYSEFGHNFVKTILRLSRERDSLDVVADQIGSPTYATDLAKAALEVIHNMQTQSFHIYHYSNEGACGWYDFAQAILELSGIDCTVRPVETRAYPTPACRPHYSLLNKGKIKQQMGMQIPYWRTSLQNCLVELKGQPA